MTSVLLRRVEDTDTEGGRDWGDAAAGQGTPWASRSWKRPGTGPLPEPSEGVQPCWHLGFRLLSPRNWERTRFCCFKPPGAEGLKPWPAAVASPRGPGCLHAIVAAQKAQASSPEFWSHLGHPSTSQPQQGDKGRDDGTGPLGQPSLSGPCLPLESLHVAGRI